MTTYELPPEPPLGTRLVDRDGTEWTREDSYWTCAHGYSIWGDLVTHYGPLTEVPAPALPTEDGALIIASGTGFEALFENLTLMRVGDYWCGLIPGAVRPTTIVQDQITSWTEAVAVPKAKYEALRDEVEYARKADLTTMRATDLGVHVRDAAHALIAAVDGAS